VDWTVGIDQVKQSLKTDTSLQGNLDPSVLYASPEVIRAEVKRIIEEFGPDNTGHVFNLGHGIHQRIDPANVKVLVDSVHELGAR